MILWKMIGGDASTAPHTVDGIMASMVLKPIGSSHSDIVSGNAGVTSGADDEDTFTTYESPCAR